MLEIATFNYELTWSIGPAVISFFTFIIVCYKLFSRSESKGPVGYAALVESLAGLIKYVMAMTLALGRSESAAKAYISSFIFYGIYLSFAWVPGLIAFRRISKETANAGGNMVALFGYLWAFIIVVVGFTLTIILAVNVEGMYEVFTFPFESFGRLLQFMFYSGWGFFSVYLILLSMNTSHLSGPARKSIMAYSALNMLAVLVYTILANARPVADSYHGILVTIYAVPLVFCNIPIAIGSILAAYYGNTWRTSTFDISNGDKVEVTEPTRSSQIDVEK